jgi:hypothetical protein
MTAQATFRNAAGKATKGLRIGPVTAAQRGGVSKLLRRSARTRVPPGTRSIAVELDSTRSAGFYNDGAADDVSLVLAATKALGRLDLILFKKHGGQVPPVLPGCQRVRHREWDAGHDLQQGRLQPPAVRPRQRQPVRHEVLRKGHPPSRPVLQEADREHRGEDDPGQALRRDPLAGALRPDRLACA